MLNCAVDHILQEFYTLFLARFRTYKIATPPQTKMTSKDDIKGFVSSKFLSLCVLYKVCECVCPLSSPLQQVKMLFTQLGALS